MLVLGSRLPLWRLVLKLLSGIVNKRVQAYRPFTFLVGVDRESSGTRSHSAGLVFLSLIEVLSCSICTCSRFISSLLGKENKFFLLLLLELELTGSGSKFLVLLCL